MAVRRRERRGVQRLHSEPKNNLNLATLGLGMVCRQRLLEGARPIAAAAARAQKEFRLKKNPKP